MKLAGSPVDMLNNVSSSTKCHIIYFSTRDDEPHGYRVIYIEQHS